MYMICMIHAIGYVDSRWTHWLVNVCFAGVPGFVLISGFYGLRFSWRKVVRIEGVGIGCALTVVGLALALGVCPRGQALAEIVRLWKGYWFIHAYVVMMVLAGLLGADAQESRSELQKRALPVIALVYGWSFLALVPCVQRYVPRTSGLEAFSGVTLFAVYLVGRLYRLFDWESRFKMKYVLPATILCGVMSACVIPPTSGWGGALARYNSPFLLGLSLGLFWLFRRALAGMKLPATVLAILTPSVLSVYLIHCNSYGNQAFAFAERMFANAGLPLYAIFFVLATLTFVAGFVLDVPRRLLSLCLQKTCRLFDCLIVRLPD